MRINKVKFLKDFKCIKKNTVIDFSGTGNYCALIGLNGSGKTSVIDYLFASIKNVNYKGSPIYKKIILDDEYRSFDDILPLLPKSIIYNYSGESKTGTNVKIKDIKFLQLDYRIWGIASLVLQIINDPIIDYYNLQSGLIADKLIKANNIYNNYQGIEQKYRVMVYMFEEVVGLKHINHEIIDIKSFLYYAIELYIKREYATRSYNHKIKIDNIYSKLFTLSEGQKKLLVLKLMMHLADEGTLVLLDEPDANLDIQKKRELFEMIQSCKGQVILTTHDPIMTKWMKNHLIFIKDGQQISSDICYAINEMSGGEVSFQENMLMFQKKYLVIVEGKSDLACIEKAIRSNGLSSKFEPIFFLAQNSASSTKATFDNLLGKLVDNNNSIKQILFLFDADDAGYKGKVQIDNIKEEHKSEDISQKIDYLFYRPCYKSADDNDFDNKIKDYFYLEGYFPTECYPGNNGETTNLIKHGELFDILDDKSEDKYINFNEIQRLKFFTDTINKKNGLKKYFGDKTDKIDEKYFLGFRPLLDKILDKFGLK